MDRKKVLFLTAVLLLICLISSVTVEYRLPPLIRLHILANSNSERDQALKYQVRDQIITLMGEKFKEAGSIDESRQILLNSLPLLEKEASLILRQAGSQDKVRAVYGSFDFPARNYGTFSLPAGKYEALRLVIGSGSGANWWCVLFPPLCLVDAKKANSADILLSGENLSQEKVMKIKPAFKVVEIWNNTIRKMAAEM